KMMKQAMKRLGMKQEEIDAVEVIIKTNDKQIVFSNPQVSKINAMGQETFQVIGDYEEQELETFNKEDVKTVMEQANCSEKEAKEALEEEQDLAKAILKLKKD
ncbi:MAG: nascent polypeptide-associated complex protein, partial [Nanoarchaeota archaeon]